MNIGQRCLTNGQTGENVKLKSTKPSLKPHGAESKLLIANTALVESKIESFPARKSPWQTADPWAPSTPAALCQSCPASWRTWTCSLRCRCFPVKCRAHLPSPCIGSWQCCWATIGWKAILIESSDLTSGYSYYSDNRILWHCWGMAKVSQVVTTQFISKLNRVIHQVVHYVLFTSNWELHFSTMRLYCNRTFVLMSTKGSVQRDGL